MTELPVVNKLSRDMNGQFHGVLLMNKPVNITSHDLVDDVRHFLRTRRVGHAGALDPFASGLMIILVGNATRLSDKFLNLDKTYTAEVALGVKTPTLDIESEVTSITPIENLVSDNLNLALSSFKGNLKQQVPVFSSVKVQGYKLRVLARKCISFKIIGDNVNFNMEDGQKISLEIPTREVIIKNIVLENLRFETEIRELNLNDKLKESFKIEENYKFPVAKIKIECSKGFYVRQFAYDLGNKILAESGGTLISLSRDKIGNFAIKDTMSFEEIEKLLK